MLHLVACSNIEGNIHKIYIIQEKRIMEIEEVTLRPNDGVLIHYFQNDSLIYIVLLSECVQFLEY